ncbi:MAG: hypothetical protein P1V13_20975, partial [Rhizobiaceae bacterium]|nr:hypothetical protein [Rhizobiaceae bacterium]
IVPMFTCGLLRSNLLFAIIFQSRHAHKLRKIAKDRLLRMKQIQMIEGQIRLSTPRRKMNLQEGSSLSVCRSSI